MLGLRLRRRDLAWTVALLTVVTAVWVARGDVAEAGAEQGVSVDLVYVAVATNYPDSLGIGPGAGALATPVILVPTDPPIPSVTQTELIRLDPKKVVIIGGESAISAAMQNALESLLPTATVERIGGANRYETNALFAASVYPIESWSSVAAAAFTVTQDSAGFASGTQAYSTSGGTLYASIDLPHGAEILELKAIGYDSSVLEFEVALGRSGMTTTQEIASVSSATSGGDTAFATMTITAGREIVDNENWAYWVSAGQTASNRTVYGVMVRYRLGAPGA
ncbi:MAG: cell wall-binding repeat-containing protein [Acidimicrobiia bacterium]|nr:MAG: cell wall-binding repeat-containing protein [Acidimicrobiia bacterium]